MKSDIDNQKIYFTWKRIFLIGKNIVEYAQNNLYDQEQINNLRDQIQKFIESKIVVFFADYNVFYYFEFNFSNFFTLASQLE